MFRVSIIALAALGLTLADPLQSSPTKMKKTPRSKSRRPKACKSCDNLLFSSYFSKNASRRFLEQRENVMSEVSSDYDDEYYNDDNVASFFYDDFDDDSINLDDFTSTDDEHGDDTDDMDHYRSKVNFISRISEITDIIYKSDDLRCLLLNIVKTTREVACERSLNNHDDYGDDYYIYEHAEEEKRNDLDDLMRIANMNKTLDEILHPFIKATTNHNNNDRRRKLMTDISTDYDKDLTIWDNLGDGPQEENFIDFFQKCYLYGIPQTSCLLLFALVRTVDASVCHYFQEKRCTLEKHCTPTLKFRSTFSQKMSSSIIAYPIPFFGITISDITGPCDGCIQEEYRCSALCNFVDGYNKCNTWYIDTPFAI